MKQLTTCVVVTLVLAIAASAALKSDFSGTWVLDKSKSQGLPPNLKEQTLTIKQTGDQVEVQTKLVMNEGPEQLSSTTYMLNGHEVEFETKGPDGAQVKGKRIAAWSADGNTIEIKETLPFGGPNGTGTTQTERRWSLANDKTLIIAVSYGGASIMINGETLKEIKRTYVRQ